VADSPELKRVIGEQSQGLAATAVNELRERSARADTVAESVLRRLTGRKPASVGRTPSTSGREPPSGERKPSNGSK
jgi:hypothetical protein